MGSTRSDRQLGSTGRHVPITRALLEVLKDVARVNEPTSVTLPLGALPGVDLGVSPSDTSVLTHFYFGGDRSVDSVFGMDLGTPPNSVAARFVSHPQGRLAVARTDDLAPFIVVGVPPWDDDCIAAFDRSGRRRPLQVVDATPPAEEVPR
jgi:hypothetical protein